MVGVDSAKIRYAEEADLDDMVPHTELQFGIEFRLPTESDRRPTFREVPLTDILRVA